jgi:hypothetical protein
MSVTLSAQFDDFAIANVLRSLSICGCSWSKGDRALVNQLNQLKELYLTKTPSVTGSILFLTSLNKLQFSWIGEKRKEPFFQFLDFLCLISVKTVAFFDNKETSATT